MPGIAKRRSQHLGHGEHATLHRGRADLQHEIDRGAERRDREEVEAAALELRRLGLQVEVVGQVAALVGDALPAEPLRA